MTCVGSLSRVRLRLAGAADRLLFTREHDPATGYEELVIRRHPADRNRVSALRVTRAARRETAAISEAERARLTSGCGARRG